MEPLHLQEERIVYPPKKKSHITLWTLLLAAAIALPCGCLGSCLANSQAEEVEAEGLQAAVLGDGGDTLPFR